MSGRRLPAEQRVPLRIGQHLGGLADGTDERGPLLRAQLRDDAQLLVDLDGIRQVRTRQHEERLLSLRRLAFVGRVGQQRLFADPVQPSLLIHAERDVLRVIQEEAFGADVVQV